MSYAPRFEFEIEPYWLDAVERGNKMSKASQAVELKPGQKYRYTFGIRASNLATETRHVRAIVDDHVVYCVWSKRKQVWRYHVDWVGAWKSDIERGKLERV